jgi:flavodoxin I
MKTLVVYDSVYGNTKAIAQAIGDAIPGEVQVLHAGQVKAADWAGLDLLVAGAPTQGGRPTEAVQAWLDQAPANAFAGTRVAAFDTRLTSKWVRIFGYAAPRIADRLKEKGGTPAGSPGGFFVKGRTGPLKEGEVERAARWAKEIAGDLT